MTYNAKHKESQPLEANDNLPRLKEDGAKLLDSLTEFYKDYLILPEHAAEVSALWVVFTHIHDAFYNSPRIVITSPVPSAGKSRYLKITTAFSSGGIYASDATPAGVRRTINERTKKKQPFTLGMDEVDTFLKEYPKFRTILNGGFDREAASLITGEDANGKLEADMQLFFAPIAIAGIGRDWLWDALETRAFIFTLQKKRPDETVGDWNSKKARNTAKALREEIADWVKTLPADIGDMRPEVGKRLDDRFYDMWRPLLVIADQAGGHWPETARRIAVALSTGRSVGSSVRELATLRDAFGAKDKLFVSALPQTIRRSGLNGRLAEFGIRGSHQIRIGDVSAKGFERHDFEEAWARYL